METSVEHDKVLEQVVLSTVVASLPKCLRPLSPFCICCHFFPGLSGTSPSDAVSHYSPSLLLSARLVYRGPSKRYKQKWCTQQIHLPSTQQTKHLAQFRFWWRNIHLVNSTEILVLFAVDLICMPQTSLHTLSFLSFSSSSQQIHKISKNRLATCWKNIKTLSLLAREKVLVPVCQELVAFHFACFLLTLFIQVAQMGRIIWQAYP